MTKTLLSLALAAVTLTACGGASDEDVSKAVEDALAKQAASQAAAAPAQTTAPAPAPVETAAEPVEAAVAPAKPIPGSIVVPNVVGKDHQLAQDTMQAAGLYNLTEEDATGAGRMLLIDRNWVVVEQIPAAGTKVSEDTTITLRSKKKGE